MSPTIRFWRSMSVLVVRASTSDCASRSSRLIGLPIRSANALRLAMIALIAAVRSYDGRRHGAG